MKDRLTDEDGWDQITELGRTQIERGQTTQIEYKYLSTTKRCTHASGIKDVARR